MSGKILRSVAFALVVVAMGMGPAFAGAAPQAAAQDNRLAGTWNYVPERSTFSPGPARYKSMTVTFSDSGQMTVEGIDAQGKPVKATYNVVADGKSHPVTGMAEFDSSTLNRLNATTTTYIYSKGRTSVVNGSRVLSADGNTLTFVENTLDRKGVPMLSSRLFFARPGFDLASLAPPPGRAAGAVAAVPQSSLTPEEIAAAAVLEKGDNDAAIAAFTKVIQGKPTTMLYYDYVSRGIAYAKKDQNELAIADFDAALKLKPDDSDTRFRRGGTRLQLKQYDAAIEDFGEVVKADPMNAMAYRLRGFAYNTLGKDVLAGADYDKACELNKDLCQK